MKEEYRFVTVIAPVKNGGNRVDSCINALLNQDYPSEKYEIIIVDNGSTDGTINKIKKYPVKLIIEKEIPSPYIARNAGIKASKGEVFAFIDINCVACSTWISEGLHALESKKADLVGGQVTFTFSSKNSLAEHYDSLVNVQMKKSIEENNRAKGGNLFIEKEVFNKLGLWPVFRSGGDVKFTELATKSGFKLVFAEKAEVFYPARGFWALMKKSFRVGRGQVHINANAKRQLFKITLFKIVHVLKPPSRKNIYRRIIHEGTNKMRSNRFSIWMISWLVNIANSFGFFCELFRLAGKYRKT